LLPLELLSKTNELDQADWNYRPGLGWVARLRLRAVAAALEGRHVERMLEVGYGSGVFLPQLATHCDELYGVDLHQNAPMVTAALRAQGVQARLTTGSAMELPYADDTFDVVVAVSMLEFVPDVRQSVHELLRVTRPGGSVVAVTPGKSALLDFGLKVMTGERGEDTFDGRRGSVVPALYELGKVESVTQLPPAVHRAIPLYSVVVASPAASPAA
jgi:ubiquinone/menaquinone biosynthesis C-methylase UbiE